MYQLVLADFKFWSQPVERNGSSARTRTWNPSVNSCGKGFQRQAVMHDDTLLRMLETSMFIDDCASPSLAISCEAF